MNNLTVLILSQSLFEQTTNSVIDWILHYGHKFIRINGTQIDLNTDKKALYDSESSTWGCLDINVNAIESIWFRRWGAGNIIDVQLANELNISVGKDNFIKYYKIIENTEREISSISMLLLYQLTKVKVKYLTKPHQMGVNKLIVLDVARKNGLNVPNYIITDNKIALRKFVQKKKKVIVKDINAPFVYYTSEELALSYAELIDKNNLPLLPDQFYPSLIQEYIEKDIELRIFFLDGECYSMAIFSQLDETTKTDFRKYNLKKPSRTVPYKLPDEIRTMIINLMNQLDLVTGSIDMVKTKKDEYFFLEVNPIGQFGMVSYPCNYYLERKVAQYLINEEK